MQYIFTHGGVFLLTSLALCVPGVLWDALFLRERLPAALRPVAFLATGAATWMVVTFGLCSLHLLRQSAVLLVLAALIVATVFAWRRRPRTDRVTGPGESRGWLVIAVPVVLLFGAFFLIGMMPRLAGDSDAYHLTIPKLYVAAGGFRRIPFNVYSNWPLNTELLYALVLLFHDFISATLIHFWFGVAASIAILCGCRLAVASQSRWAGWLAVAFFWMNNVIQTEVSAAYVDLAYVLFFVAAFFFSYQALASAEQRRTHLVLAGCSAGILAGLKLNGIIGAACVAALFLAQVRRSPNERVRLREWLAFFALPAAALAVVWPIKTWVLTGNPAYPFLHRYFGGPEWSEHLTTQFTEWQHSIGMGREPIDYLLLPFRILLDGGPGYDHFDGILSPAWLALVPLTVVLGWRQRFVRACLGIAGLYFVCWALSSQQVRFLMPAVALLAMAAGVGIVEGVERYVREPSLVALPALGVAASALLVLNSTGMFRDGRDWLLQVYLPHGATLKQTATPPVYGFIDRQLPADARILLLDSNRGFFLDRDFIADSFFEASQVVDWLGADSSLEGVYGKLREAKITHILVQEANLGIPYPPGLIEMLQQRRGLRTLFHDERIGQWLFAVCDTPTCAQPVAASH